MPKNIKTLRVASAGATASDGRTIEASWLKDIAETYDSKTYGARCWIEHLRSTMAEGLFPAVGDVLSVYTKTEKINNKDTLCLYATINALPSLIAINKQGQKIYSSIEVQPNFADTGRAYLMGLAFTDSPASLGTEALKFNSYAMKNSEHVFSTALETQLVDSYQQAVEFAQQHPEAAPLFKRVQELEKELSDKSISDKTPSKTPAPSKTPPPIPAKFGENTAPADTDVGTLFSQFKTEIDDMITPLKDSMRDLGAKIEELEKFKTAVEQTETVFVDKHDGDASDVIAATY